MVRDGGVDGNFGNIVFTGAKHVRKEQYEYAQGFNKTTTASVVVIDFSEQLTTTIRLA